MMNELVLEKLLNRYGIDGETFVKNNPKVVSRCKYDDVVSALDFLIDELSVSPRNILKTPSVLYYGVNNLRENYKYLIDNGFKPFEIIRTLHILNTDSNELKRTFEYLRENYGIKLVKMP